MPLDKDIQDRYSSDAASQAAVRSSSSSDYYERDLRRSKYEINVLKYPSDLGSQDLLHYVEFGINVRGKSELDKSKRLFEVSKNPDSANLSEEELSKVVTNSAAVLGAVAGFSITKNIAKAVTKSGALARSPAATAAGQAALGVVGAAVGGTAAAVAVNANDLLKPDTSYRISDVITLHVDGPPSVRYSMNYTTNKDLGTLAGIIKAAGVEDTLSNLVNAGGELAAAAITSFAKLPGMFGATDVKAVLGASSKTALNPFKEVIFESVDFRSFSFKYKFLPKNKQESESIRNIIKLFKYHMHPELSKNKLFFIYPSEFQIAYYFQNSENSYFHKFAPCVLTSMDVSYGGEQFSSFDDGNPTEVNISLTFTETEILTKQMVDRGY